MNENLSESGPIESKPPFDNASISDITDPRVKAVLKHVEGNRILDVGCVQHSTAARDDPNWLHQYLYSIGDEVLGIDIDQDAIETLDEEGYNVQLADAETLDVSGEWDCIVAGEVVEHLSNPGLFLDAAAESLAEDGKLVLSTPRPWCWPRLRQLATKGEPYVNEEHTHYQDGSTLKSLLERHGYKAEIEYTQSLAGGITPLLYRLPVPQLRQLGACQIVAVARQTTIA